MIIDDPHRKIVHGFLLQPMLMFLHDLDQLLFYLHVKFYSFDIEAFCDLFQPNTSRHDLVANPTLKHKLAKPTLFDHARDRSSRGAKRKGQETLDVQVTDRVNAEIEIDVDPCRKVRVHFYAFDTKTFGDQFQIDPNVGNLFADFVRQIDTIAPTFLDHVGQLAGFTSECQRQESFVLTRE